VLDIQFMTEDFEARLMRADDAQTISGLLYGSGRSRTSTTVVDFTLPNRRGLGRAGQP
jgi:hypothetical protein